MAWNWLSSWRRRKKRLDWNVVLYTRQGCHLCAQALEQLEQTQRRYEFVLRQVDIDDDPQLVGEYGTCVPVIVINGRVRFRGVINPVLLKRLLEGG